jgi:hypothetical protein
VVVDALPLKGHADSLVMCCKANDVVLVVRSGFTRERTARWALHNVERTERQLGATTTSLFPSQLARLRDEIARFQAEIEEIFARAAQGNFVEQIRSEDPSPDSPAAVELRHGAADVVYQLTIQVFPLSRRI